MISLTLQCSQGHQFASYFKSRQTCDDMIEKKLVDCPHCGDTALTHGLNSPHIKHEKIDEPLVDKKILALKKELGDYIKKNYQDVGKDFAEVATKMHYGEIPHKNIYGQMNGKDARILHEQAIDFYPLPNWRNDN